MSKDVRKSLSLFENSVSGKNLEQVFENYYIVTNRKKYLGASALLNRNLMCRIAEKLGTDRLVVLPSSINEALVTDGKGCNMEMMSRVVKNVNFEAVAPKETLSDRAYIMQIREGGEIQWIT
jgi:hypothetical protein